MESNYIKIVFGISGNVIIIIRLLFSYNLYLLSIYCDYFSI